MPLYFSMKVTAFKTWKETHQSENLWKGGVALHGWSQKGSTFNFAHGAVEPCMWALSADAGKWLVLCLYGYHKKKKINIKLEVSQHGEVVCFQLCGNIWHFPFSTLTHQLLDAGFFIHKYRNVILFILFLFLFLVDCQASNYGVILLHLLSRWTQPLGFHISVGSNCGWSRISPGLLALIISVCQRVRDSDSPVWR